MHKTDGNSVESGLQGKQLHQFKVDVSDGLNSDPRKLPSKYFYDEIGDDLFVQIMGLPEYYLTRAELEIFQTKTDELIDSFQLKPNEKFELIELGAGDGTKTYHLLDRLLERDFDFTYMPVDISQNALEGLENSMQNKLPSLAVEPEQGDYFRVLNSIDSPLKKVILFLGSNIGNLLDQEASRFIKGLSQNMNTGDILLLGTDLIKPEDIVLPAYNDEQGITAKFNLNLLNRINNELNANFDLNHWSHAPYYDEEEGIAKSYLRSDKDQEVYIQGIGQDFFFEEGELIHTEISRKYNDQIINDIIHDSKLAIAKKVLDDKRFFADYILTKT
jgi:L-histidine N-alpha-methyltransferase